MNTTPKNPTILSGLLMCVHFCKILIHNNYLVLLMVAYNSDNVNYFYLTECYRKIVLRFISRFIAKKYWSALGQFIGLAGAWADGSSAPTLSIPINLKRSYNRREATLNSEFRFPLSELKRRHRRLFYLSYRCAFLRFLGCFGRKRCRYAVIGVDIGCIHS